MALLSPSYFTYLKKLLSYEDRRTKLSLTVLYQSVTAARATTPSTADSNRYFFYQAYCAAAPVRTWEMSNLDYCAALDRQVAEFCRDSAVPLLECVTQIDTNIVAEDCADVWLGARCDPTQPSIVLGAPSGIAESCKGLGISNGPPELNVLSVALPALDNDEVCSDGHRYVGTCEVSPDCTMTCDCSVDSQLVRTVNANVVNYRYPYPDVLAACGW